MGGGGTVLYALHHPEMFSAACPLSASVRTSSADRSRLAVSDTAGLTKEQIDNYLNKHNALYLIDNMPDKQKTMVRWYVDCGDDDFLYEGNSLMHIAMRKKEIPHEFRIRDGGHTWTYWREALPEVLDFISRGFHR